MNEPQTTPNDYVTVRLVGGPRCWADKTLANLYRRADIFDAPVEDLVTYLTVPDGRDLPPRNEETEDINPQAVYAAERGEDRTVWHFRGWFPAGASDPDPGWYLTQRLAETATAADRVLNGHPNTAFADAEKAAAWLDEHHDEIVDALRAASACGDHDQALALAAVLDTQVPRGPHNTQEGPTRQ